MILARSAPSLDGAEAWLYRADEHLGELEKVILPMLKREREAAIRGIEADLQRDFTLEQGAFQLTQPAAPVPVRVSVLLGEAVQALRRCLDYLIYELAWLDKGKPQGGTQFPLEDCDDDFWRRLNKVKGTKPLALYLKGVRGEHATVIERHQPYKAAWAKALRSLSNPDKHKHLTVTDQQGLLNMTLVDPAKKNARFARRYDGFTAILPSGQDMDMKFGVTFYIALEDGTRVVDALHEIQQSVNYVLLAFKPCFAGKCPH